MDVIWHHFQSQYLTVELGQHLSYQSLQPLVDGAIKHLTTVLGTPDEMVVDQGDRSSLASVFLGHDDSVSTFVPSRKEKAGLRSAAPLSHPSKRWACGRKVLVNSVDADLLVDLRQIAKA